MTHSAFNNTKFLRLNRPRLWQRITTIFVLWCMGIHVVFGQESTVDWRANTGTTAFIALMVIAIAIAAIVFIVIGVTRYKRQDTVPISATGATSMTGAETADRSPRALRLLGLLLLAIAILLLGWTYLAPAERYLIVERMIYPASFAVALVLLFDKATRSWHVKGAMETVREWLLCDAIVFLLLLGFLNLTKVDNAAEYRGFFWDILYVVLFFFVFWCVDRLRNRSRFLIFYIYMILVPILLWVWRSFQGVTRPEDLSWWSTIWPFTVFAIIFFILEIITLIATRESERHGIAGIKDALFVVGLGVLLIIAIPDAA